LAGAERFEALLLLLLWVLTLTLLGLHGSPYFIITPLKIIHFPEK